MTSLPFDDPRFELRGQLGSGGMGTVHRAFDRLAGREVALKVGRVVSGAESEPDAARIAEEFALLATLDHAGLVRVLDFGVRERGAWLTSEIVEGPRLDLWAGRARPDVRAWARLVGELLDTLGWLHAQGLVHGDIKPANILVAASGPVLIDFGLAGAGEALFGATRTYAAPELLAGGTPSAASDLYALGRTLERLGLARTVPSLRSLIDGLVAERGADRLTVTDAKRLLSAATGGPADANAPQVVAGRGEAARVLPWAGAIERALAEEAMLRVRIPEEHRAKFLGALATRLMLSGRRAWRLPDAEGLAGFAQVAAALGRAVATPSEVRAEDQREVLDAFADRLIATLKSVPGTLRPVLLVTDHGRVGAAGRFVLARLIEARALPGFVVAGSGPALERGAEAALRAFEVLASEAGGRRWESEWSALSAAARAAARELKELGGAARSEELSAGRSALVELGDAGLTERAAAGRTALRPEVLLALGGVLSVAAPGDDERRRWCEVLSRASAPSAAMQRALGRHAAALGEAQGAAVAWRRAAALAEAGLSWAEAGADHAHAAGLLSELGDDDAAFDEARAALGALRAAGGGPGVDAALEIAERSATTRERRRELVVLRARTSLERGLLGEAERLATTLLDDGLPGERLRFEALLVRGTARSQGADKAGAEEDLAAAARLAEAMGDLHALGRTTNNLGMLAFHRGDLEGAAAAWERAAEAKAHAGDRRGERIGRHNRGLALRELGRLSEAEQVAEETAALSEAIGDEVGRATSALAKAQLALDRGEVARARAALATFGAIGWKPALVAADGQVVRARTELLAGDPEAARAVAQGALDEAVEQRLQPVAAEAWALLQIITRAPSEPPELVRERLVRAREERGGLALLLLFVEAWREAQVGRWGDARRVLGEVERRLVEGPLPPAARVGLPLAIAAARIVEPRALTLLEGIDGGREAGPGVGVPRPAGGLPSLLEEWPGHLRGVLGARRVELHPSHGDGLVDADDGLGGARFGELARRVMKSGERFEALDDDGSLEAIAWPLALGETKVGALVASFARRSAAGSGAPTDVDMASTLQVLALTVGHDGERRRRERAEAEVARLEAELRQRLDLHEAEVTALRDALEQSQSALALRHDYGHIVHRSAAMRRVLQTLDKVTDRDLPVLILGESGVGKELLARALHFNGPRAKKRFVAENCGAIPKDLFESTFFGHVRGAFTGALAQRQGLFEAADGGTLFLDEIGELPLEMQVKLLRVLQDRKVRPVGSSREIPVDFRLVCATNRDLGQMVAQGRFREDLFYRIAVVKVDVPPLRERPEDIIPIAEHLLAHHGKRLGRMVRLTPEAADRLAAHAFPGNVRELDNELLRALALSDGPEIRPRHLSAALQGRSEPRRKGGGQGAEGALETLEAAFARVEKELLVRHLRASRGQKLAAAKSLGLSRPGLDAKLARHGIDPKELARSLKEPPR